MRMTFSWKCSYQNMLEYEVYGIAKIEVFRKPEPGLEACQRSQRSPGYNYDREETPKWNGAVVHWNHYRKDNYNRWTPELWEAFIAHLKANYESDQALTAKYARENPTIDYSEFIHDFNPPAPIYWDRENGWKPETLELTACQS